MKSFVDFAQGAVCPGRWLLEGAASGGCHIRKQSHITGNMISKVNCSAAKTVELEAVNIGQVRSRCQHQVTSETVNIGQVRLRCQYSLHLKL